ncbi:MAG TPA: DUF58 domain-containing protein [Acidimicrobiia bacterium]|nr:DUF58 domain-containing protein [Acidimicrobiia bacterium]
MLTTRGWALLGAGLALAILWWLLGDEELLLAGTFLAAGAGLALLYVRLRTPDLRIGRRLGTTAVHNGDTVQVTLSLRNPGPRAVRNLSLVDEVEGLGVASFEISAVEPDELVTATYRVLCRPRGVYRVGPTRAAVSDPLGLATVDAPDGPADQLVVYPTVERLEGFPIVRGQDPSMAASRPEHSQRGGEDFYTLREYQRGDDLRRVHWPSSARTDKLMIRQLETPWQSRALVLLDVRSRVYESDEAFETAVSGAASVVTHLVKSGFDADLWAGDPQTIDATRYGTAMEKLALVAPHPEIDLESVATRIRHRGGGGALVIVTGTADRALISVQQLLSRDYPTSVLLGVSSTTPQTLAGFHRLGVATLTVHPGGSWAEKWMTSMGETWDVVSAS